MVTTTWTIITRTSKTPLSQEKHDTNLLMYFTFKLHKNKPSWRYYYTHFSDKKREALRCHTTYPWSPTNKLPLMFCWCCPCLVATLHSTLCDPMDWSRPGSSVHEISLARILEWVAISFSKGSSWPRDWTHISFTARQVLCHWATRVKQYVQWKCSNHFPEIGNHKIK